MMDRIKNWFSTFSLTNRPFWALVVYFILISLFAGVTRAFLGWHRTAEEVYLLTGVGAVSWFLNKMNDLIERVERAESKLADLTVEIGPAPENWTI
jgi:hypothetical protein